MKASPEAIRWEPTDGLPELPLSIYDLSWKGSDEVLVCSGLFWENPWFPPLRPPTKGIEIAFRDVHAFMSCDEFSDILDGMDLEVPLLKEAVPYGGCWPFAEILNSPWLAEVAERDGALEPTDFRHWAVITTNMTLHVMAYFASQPRFRGWLK